MIFPLEIVSITDKNQNTFFFIYFSQIDNFVLSNDKRNISITKYYLLNHTLR
ncbi:hypothetical protein EAVNNN508_03479 [Elizabethkingia anophelis]|uniref:Uncharacterized protein n=1 Tax=Elizabethkingia anophelis TaxID=1117645 RepID=X5KBC0_9FLAO|nr:hypothetical protein EAVNVB490_00681 [Elizabethkingia anophelis]CAH1139628.1 hypothetical protein EAVVTKC53_00260 [Elizabethkingia anophelis]CAI9669514.1 hypothetical protein EAVNNN508_00681 [Elizabethkingia anophelis]CAI9676071.1 hypothetical protein EAVNVB490_03481 [Elizabethkingia anophelis]CAI9686521.1 hypothetical protein EAVVTKC53_03403 [Elizabethkingia anophelis]